MYQEKTTMTREELIAYAETLSGASTDMPFDLDFESTVFRHSESRKWFALWMRVSADKLNRNRQGEAEILNLKCNPEDVPILCELYPAIIPAYHMNKRHWISVVLSDGTLSEKVLKKLLEDSYRLTASKSKKLS